MKAYSPNAHARLLSKWRSREAHSAHGFVADGVIDPTRWCSARPTVLFLLKEAYGNQTKPEDWDLCETIRSDWKGPKYTLWWNAAYWAYAFHTCSANGVLPLPDDDASWQAAGEALLASAVVNIKKSAGRPSSDPNDLHRYATADAELLARQVDLIAPDVVICGGTWQYVKHLWPEAQLVYDRVWRASHRFYLDFWHPANQYPKRLNYYALAHLASVCKAAV